MQGTAKHIKKNQSNIDPLCILGVPQPKERIQSSMMGSSKVVDSKASKEKGRERDRAEPKGEEREEVRCKEKGTIKDTA